MIIYFKYLSFFASVFFCALHGARIEDLTDVKGSRSNQLYGYGIVTGLAGQGDSRIEYTELGILNALERLGIRADKADKSRNIAAVMVTADIGPFAKNGSKLDVTVSSIGNADSLQGGILLQTALEGADGNVYAVGARSCFSRRTFGRKCRRCECAGESSYSRDCFKRGIC